MATIHHIAFGILILQLYVTAAPSGISKLEDITEEDETNIKIGSEPHTIKTEVDDSLTQSARQKRFYNYYGYGFPPISPLIYPNNAKRDQSSDTAVYGSNDPFVQIHRRLLEIANIVRQPTPPPPPSHVPIFFPVLFIPQIGCGCFPERNNTTPQTSTDKKNDTNPDVFTRLPDLEDNRQNWGFLINDTDVDYDEEESSRPISFDPISINRPISRPPPPVEHGSSQGNSQDSQIQSTTTIPEVIQPAIPAVEQPLETNTNELSNVLEPPSSCDGAILSCCHQLQVTYDCFALQGCPDQTTYGGNPCDFNVILRVIDRFQRFYGQRIA